jgi:hypothetical protein
MDLAYGGGGIMHPSNFIAAFAIIVIALTQSISVSFAACSSGQTMCPAGLYGPGKCYVSSSSTCFEGVTCSKSQTYCPPGANGPGQCYTSTTDFCVQGTTCSKGQEFCAKSGGAGRCYNPSSSRCDAGTVVPIRR